MDYHDLPAFMQTLAANPTQSARALEIAILTFARTNEVQNMRWSQLDLESGLWNLSTLDTKNERLKRTPLPRQTLAYLREAYQSRLNDAFVFPGRSLAKPMSNMTMLKLLKHITADETLTVHGFRTTFRTWAQEETDFEEETVEHCLHHITGDDAESRLQARRSAEEAARRDSGLRRLRDAAAKKQRDADPGGLRFSGRRCGWAYHRSVLGVSLGRFSKNDARSARVMMVRVPNLRTRNRRSLIAL